MKEIKQTTYKGTRILLGNEKRNLLNKMSSYLVESGYNEISIPIIQLQEHFKDKVGEENNNMMYTFKDRGDRGVCLAPEYTAIVQQLASTYFKPYKDVKLFYIQECFRGERQQFGRWRQFTQLGVEILNPSSYEESLKQLKELAQILVLMVAKEYKLNEDVIRGLDYYKEGKGFEIICGELGSARQVCGGGIYEKGVGFAIGIDRLMLLNK